MRNFFTLLKHELRMLFINPSTYIAAVLFLSVMGCIYWAILRGMVNTPSETLPTAAVRWPSWRRRWTSTVRSVGCGSTTRTLDGSCPVPEFGKDMVAMLISLASAVMSRGVEVTALTKARLR